MTTTFPKVCMLHVRDVKALLLATPEKGDVRHSLEGIFVDTNNERLVATDGHCMLIRKFDAMNTGIRPFIIPETLIRKALKLVGHRVTAVAGGIDIVIEPLDVGVRQIQLYTRNGFVQGTECDAKFPEYSRFVPVKLSGDHASYDPAILLRMQRALSLIANSDIDYSALSHNGDGPGIMTGGSAEALALVMPKRAGVNNADVALVVLGFKAPTKAASLAVRKLMHRA